MNRTASSILSAAALAAAVTATVAIGAVVSTLATGSALAQTTAQGGLVRNHAGMTLYTFDKDGVGQSRCYGGCATAWPPFLAAEGARDAGRLTVVVRQGGALQWALDGKPLYTFVGDVKPGDSAGDGSGGVWHAIKAGADAKATATTADTAQPVTGYRY
jgi:predicted lipoprotein with Yx(FWY)xxD motif